MRQTSNSVSAGAHHGGSITAVLGSTTLAMKAQSTLAAAAIRSEVVKAESGTSRHGCVYGIRFPANQYNNVRSILESARVTVRRYVNNDDL